MYNYNEENKTEQGDRSLESQQQPPEQTFSTSPQSHYLDQRPSYIPTNDAASSFNPYYYNFPTYYPQYNQSYLPATTQYNSFNQYAYGAMNQTYQTLNHSSPVSQATSPTVQSSMQTLSTPTNTNIKPSYVYPTPPSDNGTILSNRSSPLEKSNSSLHSTNLSNEDNSCLEKPKESLKPKEKNGKLVRRRNRVQFTQMQIDVMEAIFDKSHYPEVHVIDRLSDKLGISIERLSIWFQNRRAKFKKTKRPANSDSLFELKQSNHNSDNRARDIDSIISGYVRSNETKNEAGEEDKIVEKNLPKMPINPNSKSNFGFSTETTNYSNFQPTM